MGTVIELNARRPVRPKVGQLLYVRQAGETLRIFARTSVGREQLIQLKSRDQLVMNTRNLYTKLILAEYELVEYLELPTADKMPTVENTLIGFIINKGIPRRHLAEFAVCRFSVHRLV
jgi:hypothetical protein